MSELMKRAREAFRIDMGVPAWAEPLPAWAYKEALIDGKRRKAIFLWTHADVLARVKMLRKTAYATLTQSDKWEGLAPKVEEAEFLGELIANGDLVSSELDFLRNL